MNVIILSFRSFLPHETRLKANETSRRVDASCRGHCALMRLRSIDLEHGGFLFTKSS